MRPLVVERLPQISTGKAAEAVVVVDFVDMAVLFHSVSVGFFSFFQTAKSRHIYTSVFYRESRCFVPLQYSLQMPPSGSHRRADSPASWQAVSCESAAGGKLTDVPSYARYTSRSDDALEEFNRSPSGIEWCLITIAEFNDLDKSAQITCFCSHDKFRTEYPSR